MKVLHVIPSLSQLHGGPSRAVIDMVRSLNGAGIEAEVVTTNHDSSHVLQVPLGLRMEYGGIPVTFFGLEPGVLSSLRNFGLSLPLTRWLWQHCADFDLIHVHAVFSLPATSAMWIAKRRSQPYVVTTHGLLGHWAMRQKAFKKRAYLRIIERANLDAASAIHFTAELERDEAAPLRLTAPSFVCPYIIQLPEITEQADRQLRNEFGLQNGHPIILFLSRIHNKKGLEILIAALAANRDLPFTFIIAGSGEPSYEQHIRGLLASAGIQDRTQWAGFVSGHRKELLLQGADLFALTSHSESFGIAVLEALGAGTPVLVTPGVALAPVVARHRLGFTPDLDVAAIAAALRACLADLPAARALGARGRAYVTAHYSPATVAQQLIQVYNAILNHQPLPFVVPPPP